MKTTQSRLILSGIVAALLVGLAPIASADILQGDLDRYVTMCDVNKDGMVSRQEFMDMAAAKVGKMQNKDGMIDGKKATQSLLDMKKTDSGAGDMMSKDAYMKKLSGMFDKMDTKKAGMLDKKQFEYFLMELTRSAG